MHPTVLIFVFSALCCAGAAFAQTVPQRVTQPASTASGFQRVLPISETQFIPVNANAPVQYRITPNGTYVPGYGPSGAVVDNTPPASPNNAQQQQQAQPQDLALDQPVTISEAVEGLIAVDADDLSRTIKKWQLIDGAKLFSRADRRTLRYMDMDSSVATGTQNLLTTFLRANKLIQGFHLVVGVIPRKNMILIGLGSSEED